MPFIFKPLALSEVVLIEPKIIGDSRGFFTETYKLSDFAAAGIEARFVQDNLSRSSKGVLRGLHYQKRPKAQGKLICCPRGRIFDVAVDIRKGSPTYSKWVGVELSEENRRMLYVPEGFAHGFVVLSDYADLSYKCTGEYSPENDAGIIWNDPAIDILWPVETPLLSPKDSRLPLLAEADNNFESG
ncbi:MAG: dTDP-4-dehydrorhamnose 3,5-epimerase [Nitrospirae bacterium]|nr:MAG: dTDP-4-dehydrorhamnose 3,5-epimerase [Nitrospirota bacterium]